MANAAHNIPAPRRTELLDVIQAWVCSDECLVESHEELFYMLAGMAAIEMESYCEQVQADEGAKILEREMGVKP
jgi:predicted HAD superfamily phosphohydrolase